MRIPRSYALFRIRNPFALWNLITRPLEIYAAHLGGALKVRMQLISIRLLSTSSEIAVETFDPLGRSLTPPGSENKEEDITSLINANPVAFDSARTATFLNNLTTSGTLWKKAISLRHPLPTRWALFSGKALVAVATGFPSNFF